jgi:hypothetical protein
MLGFEKIDFAVLLRNPSSALLFGDAVGRLLANKASLCFLAANVGPLNLTYWSDF